MPAPDIKQAFCSAAAKGRLTGAAVIAGAGIGACTIAPLVPAIAIGYVAFSAAFLTAATAKRFHDEYEIEKRVKSGIDLIDEKTVSKKGFGFGLKDSFKTAWRGPFAIPTFAAFIVAAGYCRLRGQKME